MPFALSAIGWLLPLGLGICIGVLGAVVAHELSTHRRPTRHPRPRCPEHANFWVLGDDGERLAPASFPGPRAPSPLPRRDPSPCSLYDWNGPKGVA